MVCALGVVAVGAVAGCESAAEPEVTAAAEEFVAAAGEDPAAACELLAPQVKDTIETASGKGCDEALKGIGLPGGEVRGAVVWGDNAKVTTAEDTLFLRALRDGWRVTGAGCQPQGERPYDCEVGGP